MDSTPLKNFLQISYDRLKELNLEAKKRQLDGITADKLQETYVRTLVDTRELKAVTVCFSDIEGRFHMLDYDKDYLLKSYDNLTFDGSSIRGFSEVSESDLRLAIDWGSFRWLPADIFGPGKVIVFGLINDKDGVTYPSDMRGRLKTYLLGLRKDGLVANISVELEGFIFKGLNAEQNYKSWVGFDLVSTGGYFHSLPNDPLKLFIDGFAEAQRALGFENEKDHPEVAPSQFELNYSYTDALVAADQVQLYKLLARQVAANMGCTASFLPKPISGINGSGMHTNLSLARNGENTFFSESGRDHFSDSGWDFVDRLLSNAREISLTLNSSVNAFRRLDPHFEAPNQIKCSAVDRTAMIRIPLGNRKTARMEVRTVAPDTNPYLAFYTLLRTGLEGVKDSSITPDTRSSRKEFLQGNVYEAISDFRKSSFMKEIIGEEVLEKYVERKLASADRCPRELGSIVKTEEVLFHHDVTNQSIWGRF